MILRTKALVIREYTVGESDKYITLFTKEIGKIQVLAPRAKKSDKGFASGTQVFVYGDFMLTSFKDTYRLVGVEVIEMFHNIREDLMVLSYASYIMEFVQSVTEPDLSQPELLKLTLMTLKAFTKGEMLPQLIRRVFELRAMSLIGFMPQLEACTGCGEILKEDAKQIYYFSPEAGGVVCKSCKMEVNFSLTIQYTTLYCMKYIVGAPLGRLFHFNLTPDIQAELDGVCMAYVGYYIDKEFKTLDFIERIEKM
ncbi:DNA repair protein RecO [Cellulosilyticum ruminicola]|uniref:DNA repair protein RecO n=1 Tax=Cellulosilyticum ruminicola TaxID=425254 RepID=UPI0006D1B91F|nr:DNA repair protein RecO [Cellulosilyticum ruminicola]